MVAVHPRPTWNIGLKSKKNRYYIKRIMGRIVDLNLIKNIFFMQQETGRDYYFQVKCC